jgi:hypothetical protein
MNNLTKREWKALLYLLVKLYRIRPQWPGVGMLIDLVLAELKLKDFENRK